MESLFYVADGNQKVCTTSLFNFKYKKQTFWNTGNGCTLAKILSKIKLMFPKYSAGNSGE